LQQKKQTAFGRHKLHRLPHGLLPSNCFLLPAVHPAACHLLLLVIQKMNAVHLIGAS
jgi:hypothetical protein